MIIGDPSVFAIESEIKQAYEEVGLRALGFFVLNISGQRYGMYESDATMMACSFDEVRRRIGDRGLHSVPFAAESDPGKIAGAIRSAVFADHQEARYLGIPLAEFREMLYTRHIIWAPDGDEAFDDGSYVFQFDVNDRVRVIALRYRTDGVPDPPTVTDLWLAADEFYNVLADWHEAFRAEWASLPKISSRAG